MKQLDTEALIKKIGGARVMYMTSKEYWHWLLNIKNIGIKKTKAILDFYETPRNAFLGGELELKQIGILKEEDRKNIIKSKDINLIKKDYNKLHKKSIVLITKDDKKYPNKLKNIYDPPFGLYVRGSLPQDNILSIAIVGARACSDYGREVATNISRELASKGVQIISGLAHGVDSFAHAGALKAKGQTFAVLGCGIDICYPKENFNIYMDIGKQGGIISEYGIGRQAIAYQFPMRNRIISALSDGILIVEAKEKSGSLITADSGLEQGKNIYSIPGNIYSKLSEGTNNLIKMGAKIVSNSQDILEDYKYNYINSKDNIAQKDKLLEKKEKIVYACLSCLPKHMNSIAEETGFTIEELSEILLQLELKNMIKEIRKNYFSYIS